jgi:hypothetical protein
MANRLGAEGEHQSENYQHRDRGQASAVADPAATADPIAIDRDESVHRPGSNPGR